MRIQNITLSRQNVYLFASLSFLLPFFLLLALVGSFVSKALFLTSLFLLTFSLSTLFFLLKQWEKKMQHTVTVLLEERAVHLDKDSKEEGRKLHAELLETRRTYEHQVDLLQSSASKSKEKVEELTREMEGKLEEFHQIYLSYEDLRKEYERLSEEMNGMQQEREKELKHQESLMNEYQHTVKEQRVIIEKKQRTIGKLEAKVADLTYEIRSLLQLEEVEVQMKAPTPLRVQKEEAPSLFTPPQEETTPYDLNIFLHSYLERAESFVGASHLGQKRFSLEGNALDQRRLFDSLKDETTGIIFVFSLPENKLLFANNHTKTLLGWSPEKLVKDFGEMVVKGYEEWREEVFAMPASKEGECHLTLFSKNGEKVPFQCFMAYVSRGPFINHVLGIFSPL